MPNILSRAAVIVLLVAATSAWAEKRNPDEWRKDWDAAFERARAEQKLVFVDYWADWCGPCRRMDSHTFKSPAVNKRLAQFVVLRLNFDDVKTDPKMRVRAIPWYSIRDPWERQIGTFFSYYDPFPFAERLDAYLTAAPEYFKLRQELEQSNNANTTMKLARFLNNLGSLPEAYLAYTRVCELATGENDAVLAQIAQIEAALVRVNSGMVKEGLADLRKLAEKPADKGTEAAIWLSIGFSEEKNRNRKAAIEAYSYGADIAPPDTPVRQQLDAKLAKLKK